MRLKFLGAALLLVGSIQSAFAVGIYSGCLTFSGPTACTFSGTGIATVEQPPFLASGAKVVWNSDAAGGALDKFTFSTAFTNTSLFNAQISNGAQENITDLNFATEPVGIVFAPTAFMSFPTASGNLATAGANLLINFIQAGSDPIGTCLTGATGNTCTPQIAPGVPGAFNFANFNDPIVSGQIDSTATFTVSGVSQDGSGKWSAIFTSQFVGQSYEQVIAQLDTTGTVSNAYSQATLVVTSATPEPASLLMIGSGLIGLAAFLRRRAVK